MEGNHRARAALTAAANRNTADHTKPTQPNEQATATKRCAGRAPPAALPAPLMLPMWRDDLLAKTMCNSQASQADTLASRTHWHLGADIQHHAQAPCQADSSLERAALTSSPGVESVGCPAVGCCAHCPHLFRGKCITLTTTWRPCYDSSHVCPQQCSVASQGWCHDSRPHGHTDHQARQAQALQLPTAAAAAAAAAGVHHAAPAAARQHACNTAPTAPYR